MAQWKLPTISAIINCVDARFMSWLPEENAKNASTHFGTNSRTRVTRNFANSSRRLAFNINRLALSLLAILRTCTHQQPRRSEEPPKSKSMNLVQNALSLHVILCIPRLLPRSDCSCTIHPNAMQPRDCTEHHGKGARSGKCKSTIGYFAGISSP